MDSELPIAGQCEDCGGRLPGVRSFAASVLPCCTCPDPDDLPAEAYSPDDQRDYGRFGNA